MSKLDRNAMRFVLAVPCNCCGAASQERCRAVTDSDIKVYPHASRTRAASTPCNNCGGRAWIAELQECLDCGCRFLCPCCAAPVAHGCGRMPWATEAR